MKDPLIKEDVLTKKELMEWIKDFPDDAEIWLGTRDSLSNEAVSIVVLGVNDIIISPRQDKKWLR